MVKKNKKIRLEMKWNKKISDFEVSYPLGINTINDGKAFMNAVDLHAIKAMHTRGYFFESLKVTIDVDESHPLFESFFPTIAKEKKLDR